MLEKTQVHGRYGPAISFFAEESMINGEPNLQTQFTQLLLLTSMIAL